MPPKKPPKRLTDISLDNVGDYLLNYSLSVAQKSFVMMGMNLDVPKVSMEEDTSWNTPDSRYHRSYQQAHERQAFTYVDECIHWLREQFFSSIPWYCHQALVDHILVVLSKATHSAKATFRKTAGGPQADWNRHIVYVTVRFVKITLHPRVKKLDLNNIGPKALRDGIYRGLDQLTGLETLNLGSGSGPGSTSGTSGTEIIRKRVFMSFKFLQNLTSLSFTNECQNETLAVVGQNCRLLSHLDIAGSQSVTDQGASWLLGCKELTILDLYQTAISIEGYAQLLLALPRLNSVGRCGAFGQILEYLATYNRDQIQLSIKYFHSGDVSYEQLRLLTIMCPKLTHVSLYVDEDAGNLLEPLTSLKELSEVKLLACNFYTDKVDELLKGKGNQLTLLHLEHIDELDMNALCCIAENCPNLIRLVFFSCDFVENFGHSLTDKKFSYPPFQQLQSLVCVSESAPNIIEFLLVHAKRLKSVQFGSTAWFNDDTVAKVLAKGALRQVEEIRILRSYELTMRAVSVLLEQCPNLHILAEMDGWEGISQIELLQLRKKIREENLDLDTFIAWSVTG